VNIFLIILPALTGITLILLWLRVHLQADFSDGCFQFRIYSLWFAIKRTNDQRRITVSLFGVPFPRRITARMMQGDVKAVKRDTRHGAKIDDWRLTADWELLRRLLRAAVKLVIRIYRALRIDYFRAIITVATGDPMLTGVLFGALTPLLMLNRLPRTEITLNSDFLETTPAADLSASVSARPLRLLWLLLMTALTLPWLKLIRVFRSSGHRESALAGGARHG
jgi:hypothetical protein